MGLGQVDMFKKHLGARSADLAHYRVTEIETMESVQIHMWTEVLSDHAHSGR